MKARPDSSLTWKKFVYYIDESIIMFVILIAVICAEAVHKTIKGKHVTWNDFFIDIPNLIIAALISMIVYASMYTRPYSEKEKARMSKRIGNAVMSGISWRLLLGGDN